MATFRVCKEIRATKAPKALQETKDQQAKSVKQDPPAHVDPRYAEASLFVRIASPLDRDRRGQLDTKDSPVPTEKTARKEPKVTKERREPLASRDCL